MVSVSPISIRATARDRIDRTNDVLFVVVVADAAQNGMASEYKSITDGFILIATIAAWNVLLDWLNMKFPSVRKVLEAHPLMLVSNGRILSHNLRKELLTEEELLAKLREEGIENVQVSSSPAWRATVK